MIDDVSNTLDSSPRVLGSYVELGTGGLVPLKLPVQLTLQLY